MADTTRDGTRRNSDGYGFRDFEIALLVEGESSPRKGGDITLRVAPEPVTSDEHDWDSETLCCSVCGLDMDGLTGADLNSPEGSGRANRWMAEHDCPPVPDCCGLRE